MIRCGHSSIGSFAQTSHLSNLLTKKRREWREPAQKTRAGWRESHTEGTSKGGKRRTRLVCAGCINPPVLRALPMSTQNLGNARARRSLKLFASAPSTNRTRHVSEGVGVSQAGAAPTRNASSKPWTESSASRYSEALQRLNWPQRSSLGR